MVPDKLEVAVPAGLPGYKVRTIPQLPPPQLLAPAPATQAPSVAATGAGPVGMASVGGSQPYEAVHVAPDVNERPHARTEQGQMREAQPLVAETFPGEPPEEEQPSISGRVPGLPPMGPVTDVRLTMAQREQPERANEVEKARALFRAGMLDMEGGVRRAQGGMTVDATTARAAAQQFHSALELVPTAVIYRYFYAVALRYSEGFEAALGEFRHVLELDPGHYEARQQVAYGPRWHDAFAYPVWDEPPPVEADMQLPEPVRALLSQPQRPGTRLVLLREGGNKMVVALVAQAATPGRRYPPSTCLLV